MNWRIFLEKKPYRGIENLRIARKTFDGRMEIVQPFTFKAYEPGYPIPDDEIALAEHEWGSNDVRGFLQAIVNLAWEEGIRPSAIEDQRNELKAVREHLADMRSLAMRAAHPTGD